MSHTFSRRSILAYGLGSTGVALLAMTSPSQAATTTFKADLKSSSEVPPNNSTGSGSGTVTLDSTTNEITWNVTFSGLTGPATAVHIHGPAPAGRNAGVLIWLSTKGKTATSPVSGSAKFSAADTSDLMNGQCYINVHTAANPGGEIRGQLLKS